MPIHRADTVMTEHNDHPGDPCGPVTLLRYSDSGGLSQFGAIVEILPPGSRSSIKHWHASEDEMVYMLEGEVLLHEGDSVSPLKAGEAATFRAGDPVGHCLENASDADARYLIIGTRATADVVTYPDADRVLTLKRQPDSRAWTDFAGNPATSAYGDV